MDASPAAPLEIWLPDLARFDPAHPLRTLLRKADALAPGAKGYLAGLAAYFSVPGGLPAGALTRELIAGDTDGASWLCADPAWVQPDLNGARLLACGQMQLDMDEAQAFAKPLKPVFGDAGMILEVSSPDHWHVRLPPGAPTPTLAAPEQALGEDLYEHLPDGADGRRWRVLLNEVQVVLHQHPRNAERRALGLPPINSLWLWGGGTLPNRVRTTLKGVIGDDVLLGALARRAGVAVIERTPKAVESSSAGWLVDLQDLPVDEIATQWWPLIQALALKQPLQLSFASGERWLHRPWHRWRFWRGSQR
ncbi:phosphoglycerate mutase [Dyella jiangningensis]|uniref:Phosphoglycerate mutase n=1 Tax=Dyella jiangningensis TaxID=1379159 RepID=A0A328P2B2_9GAMM|nr:phosphoglycerate mutase [Dyella jiangningensis]RAO76129.1 phosphoglycerate mutase [Dyella jiangningensis]